MVKFQCIPECRKDMLTLVVILVCYLLTLMPDLTVFPTQCGWVRS